MRIESSANENQLFEFVSEELRNRQVSIVRDHKIIAEKIQKEFDGLALERESLINENSALNSKVEKLEQTNRWIVHEFRALESAYHSAIADLETSQEKVIDFEKRNKALTNRLIELEENFKSQMENFVVDRDKQIAELLRSESDLKKERDALLLRTKDYLDEQVENEDIRGFLSIQFKQLTISYTQCAEENSLLRAKLELLIQDKHRLTCLVEQMNAEFKSKLEECTLEKERLIALYETKLKQRQSNLNDRSKLASVSGEGYLTGLSSLIMLDHELCRNLSLLINRQTNLAAFDAKTVPVSDRNLEIQSNFPLKKPSTALLQPPVQIANLNSEQLHRENYLLVC